MILISLTVRLCLALVKHWRVAESDFAYTGRLIGIADCGIMLVPQVEADDDHRKYCIGKPYLSPNTKSPENLMIYGRILQLVLPVPYSAPPTHTSGFPCPRRSYADGPRNYIDSHWHLSRESQLGRRLREFCHKTSPTLIAG